MSARNIGLVSTSLVNRYHDLVDMTDCVSHDSAKQETIFRSRALAAYAAEILSGSEALVVAPYITDEFGDQGIDLIYPDDGSKTIYAIQSKFVQSASKGLDHGDVLKYVEGLKQLISGDLSPFGGKTQKWAADITKLLASIDCRLSIGLVTTSNQPMGKPQLAAIKKLLAEQNEVDEWVSFNYIGLKNVYGHVARGSQRRIDLVDVHIRNYGLVNTPNFSVYGELSASDVAQWYEEFGQDLFTKNLRKVIPSSEINDSIVRTLREDPANFWYYNNGITVICDEIKKSKTGGADTASGTFQCSNASIVNGAQSVGALAKVYKEKPGQLDRVKIHVRFVSLANANSHFGTHVTRYNNTQNKIEAKDFVSLDPYQNELSIAFGLLGYTYYYKTGDVITDLSTELSIDEATVALACLNSEVRYTVIAKSGVSKLWEDIQKPPYTAVFDKSIEPLTIWHSVLVMRLVDNHLKALVRAEMKDNRKRLVWTHGNRLILHLVLKALQGKVTDANFDSNKIRVNIEKKTSTFAKMVWKLVEANYPTSYPATIFKSPSKCGELVKAVTVIS